MDEPRGRGLLPARPGGALLSSSLVVVVMIGGLIATMAIPAAAQDGSTTSTTTPSTTTPTTAPEADGAPAPTVPTSPDGSGTSSTTEDPLLNEPPPEAVPDTDVTVPPPEGAYEGQKPFEPAPVLWSSVRAAKAKLEAANVEVDEAVEKVRTARVRRKSLEARRRSLSADRRAAIQALQEAEQTLIERSVAAFVGADVESGVVIGALEAVDHDSYVEGWVRNQLLEVALGRDDEAIEEYRRLRSRLDASVVATADTVRRLDRLVAADEVAVGRAVAERDQAADELEAFAAGSAVYIEGARFPVAEPYDTPLIDSWGFPRMPGTPDEHWHEGIDIFAPAGTPLLAAERGVISRIGAGRLGGLSLWLVGESGAHWYYAHLQSFAPGLAQGDVVEAGQVVGSVGNTGNAVGTPPHLHLQLHPGGGDPVNPYPLLSVLADRERSTQE